jgi:hypothetical protein
VEGTPLFDKPTDTMGVSLTSGRGVVMRGGDVGLPPTLPIVAMPERGSKFAGTREPINVPRLLFLALTAGRWVVLIP